MKRYDFLSKQDISMALEELRAAFLAAKDGHDVETIMQAILTNDERIKIGRRINIAYFLLNDWTYEQICQECKVGKNTVKQVARKLDQFQDAFKTIHQRSDKTHAEFLAKSSVASGGPRLIKKPKRPTGFSKKDVKR